MVTIGVIGNCTIIFIQISKSFLDSNTYRRLTNTTRSTIKSCHFLEPILLSKIRSFTICAGYIQERVVFASLRYNMLQETNISYLHMLYTAMFVLRLYF